MKNAKTKGGGVVRVLLCISYLGTNYHGWQVQPNAVTVQQVMQDAIERITGTRSDLTGCSRTDSGVHANKFYCCFTPAKEMDLKTLPKALNAVLPFDISVKSARKVDDFFHPRYNAGGKEYIYRVYNESDRDPFEYGRSLHYRYALDVDKMRLAAKHIIGRHDFSAFCASGASTTDNVRTVKYLDIDKEGSVVTVRICADGFLYNMVRIIVGTLILVSDGLINPEDVENIISSRDRSKAGPTAGPEGLYLNEVFYKEEDFESR